MQPSDIRHNVSHKGRFPLRSLWPRARNVHVWACAINYVIFSRTRWIIAHTLWKLKIFNYLGDFARTMENVMKINQSLTVVALEQKLAARVITASSVTRYLSITVSLSSCFPACECLGQLNQVALQMYLVSFETFEKSSWSNNITSGT